MKRRGTTRTRSRLEWEMLVAQVRRNKQRFIDRLNRNIRWEGGCAIWIGAHTGGSGGKSYPQISFRHRGKHRTMRVHRLFLMLMQQRPIAVGMEAGHVSCHNASCVRHVEEQTVSKNLALRHSQTSDDCPF